MRGPVRFALQYLIAIAAPIAVGQLLAGPLAAKPVQASAFFLCIALTARFLGFGPAVASTLTSASIFWTVVVATDSNSTTVQAARLLMFVTASVVVASVSRQRSKDVRLAEETYRTLVELAPDGIAVIDEHGRLSFANAALATMLGADDRATLTGRELLDGDRAIDLAAGHTLRPFEQQWVRLDGTTVDVEVAAVPIERDGTFVGHLFVRDVTDRKSAERSIQQLSGRLLQLQDDERRQIARELHDTTAQNLAAVKLNLSWINNSPLISEPVLKDALNESVSLTDQSITEIRTLSYLLHPPIIGEAGLLTSLQWYVRGFEQRSGITATLDVPDEIGQLPREMETVLFRIVQEALTNIQRHSGSAIATLRLRREPNRVRLEIEDKGRGLPRHLRNHDQALAASGLGIAGMQQRVRELGGRMDIRSEDGGTTISITIPLDE
jgi:PAS domain S-box-containing protein